MIRLTVTNQSVKLSLFIRGSCLLDSDTIGKSRLNDGKRLVLRDCEDSPLFETDCIGLVFLVDN